MMDYERLNSQLQHCLNQFDLDQPMGGCSLAVFHHGKPVSLLSHGTARLDKLTGEQTPWTPDTLSLNFSTGKGILVTLIHVLVTHDFLAYDRAIAHDWPAFAQHGKDKITLRDVLSHEARLFDIVSITEHAKDMLDWQGMLKRIEQMPVYSSDVSNANQAESTGKLVAYSALVSGWILGGLIEKVTGKSLQQTLEDYLLTPLGLIGQVYFGVPSEKVTQVAGLMREKEGQHKPTLINDSQATLDFYQSLPFYAAWQDEYADSSAVLTTQMIINSLYFSTSQVNAESYKAALVPQGSRQFNYYHPSSLQAKIPAANGVASSPALATIYAMLADKGHWQGQVIIRPEIFADLSQIQNQQPDNVMPAQMNWRLGYHRVFSRFHDTDQAFGHMGYNGSMAWCDPSRELAVAYVHNYDVTMLNDIRQFIINETVLAFFDKAN